MRDYAKISPKFWIGATGKKLRAAGAEAQLVAMYLVSSPHANMLGLYYCPEMFIAHETGLGIEGASKGLQSCIEAGFCAFDEDAEVVWVIEMARFQIDDTLNPGDKRCAGVQNAYNDLPKNRFLAEFFDKYASSFNLKTKRGQASPLQAPSKPLPSQEQEQALEQKQEQEQVPAGKPTDDKKSPPDETELQGACRETFKAYQAAYADRYGTTHADNAKVRSQVKQFVQRIGFKESPQVAAWFLGHPNSFYVEKMHGIGFLLADAEKLRTEWFTGSVMTRTKAQQSDRTQSNFNAANEAIRMLEAEDAAA